MMRTVSSWSVPLAAPPFTEAHPRAPLSLCGFDPRDAAPPSGDRPSSSRPRTNEEDGALDGAAGPRARDLELEALEGVAEMTQRAFHFLGSLDHAPLLGKQDAPSLMALLREVDSDLRAESLAFVAHLLANRGVPSLVLERHLRLVSGRLHELGPGSALGARAAFEMALELEALRSEHLPAGALIRITSELTARTGADPFALELLAVAVLDEQSGASAAVTRAEARLVERGLLEPGLASACVRAVQKASER